MRTPSKRNILIIGSTGFIGRHLLRKLISLKQYNIFCLIRNPQAAVDSQFYGVKTILADINDKNLSSKLRQYDIGVIFHCAGYVGNKSPCLLNRINLKGTENVCKLAIELNIERLVYLSSVAVVSGNQNIPLTEDLPFCATNIYGESKLEAEKKVLEYRSKGLRAVILRPPMVYGPDEPHLSRLLLGLLKLRLLPLIKGAQSRFHLVYVENLVEAMIFVMDKESFLEGSFFVADEEILTTAQVFRAMARAIGAKDPFVLGRRLENIILGIPFVGKKLKFFTKDRVYSTQQIKALGFRCPYPARESLIKSAKAIVLNNR
ncbi:MAG: NAD-dependent epimerase/dehydratase family protein [Candidatus Omnitrophota bacterium]